MALMSQRCVSTLSSRMFCVFCLFKFMALNQCNFTDMLLLLLMFGRHDSVC